MRERVAKPVGPCVKIAGIARSFGGGNKYWTKIAYCSTKENTVARIGIYAAMRFRNAR